MASWTQSWSASLSAQGHLNYHGKLAKVLCIQGKCEHCVMPEQHAYPELHFNAPNPVDLASVLVVIQLDIASIP